MTDRESFTLGDGEGRIVGVIGVGTGVGAFLALLLRGGKAGAFTLCLPLFYNVVLFVVSMIRDHVLTTDNPLLYDASKFSALGISSTQSLRSINEVLIPKFGGDGEADVERGLRGTYGKVGFMGESTPAAGVMGSSRG